MTMTADVGTAACPGMDALYPLAPNPGQQGQRPPALDPSCGIDGIPQGQVNSVTPLAEQIILLPVAINTATVVNGAVAGSMTIPANTQLTFGLAGNGDPIVGGWFNSSLGESNLLTSGGGISQQPFFSKWMAISFAIAGRPFFRGGAGGGVFAATDPMAFNPTYAGQPNGPNYPGVIASVLMNHFGYNFGDVNVGTFKNGTSLVGSPYFGSVVGSHETNPTRSLPGSAIPLVTALISAPQNDYRRSIVNVIGPTVPLLIEGDPAQPLTIGPNSASATLDTLYVPIRCVWNQMLIAPPPNMASCAAPVDVATLAQQVAAINAAKGLPGR